MNDAKTIIGAYIRALRRQRGLNQGDLASMAGISYQYLSGIEVGTENFTIQVLESLAGALQVPICALVAAAYEAPASVAPLLNSEYFRDVPLPPALTNDHIASAANATQHIIHRINRNLVAEIGSTLQDLIQGNNFSGLVSNILTNAFDQHTPYKHNHDQRYPDLICKGEGGETLDGLEVKTTINIGKGGESHNGHAGWHVVACYQFVEGGDIKFVHVMFANLRSHRMENPDWKYVGSKVNEETDSQRTETYVTTGEGTTKLRDGSAYLDREVVSFLRWRQPRYEGAPMPMWSPFAELPPKPTRVSGAGRKKPQPT